MQKLFLSPYIHSYLVKVVCYFQDRLHKLVDFAKKKKDIASKHIVSKLSSFLL